MHNSRVPRSFVLAHSAVARGLRVTILKVLLLAFLLDLEATAALQDEIRVYDDGINAPGEFGLELHVNTMPSGNGASSYAG